jgi:CDP-glycerol glycerophosphotransferase (TagB/SpsB family)
MNVSRYFLYIPYRIGWAICKSFRKEPLVVFYCGSYVDYVVFREVHKRIPATEIVAKNRTVRRELQRNGVRSTLYPSFPDIVIMARHVARKFPEPRMVKIGMRHGAYHFKEFVSADRYNAFDIYFVTSEREVELAHARGITTACVGGFPKLDPAFNGAISAEMLNTYREKLGIRDSRKTIIFTTTWDKSGSSAIERWIDRLPELLDDYHVLVTVHQWVSRVYKEKLKKTPGISYIEDKDILPYLMISDVLIGDSSSIIAEFCALDKPIITFRVPRGRRWSGEVEEMLNEMSIRIDPFDELRPALEAALGDPDALSSQRRYYSRMMFDDLDGKHAERIVEIMRARLPGLI